MDEGTLWDNSAALSLLMETHGLRRSQPGLGGAWPVAATMTLHIWWVDGAVPDELLDAIARDTPEVTVEVHASVTDRPTLAAAIDASGITNVEGVLSASPRNDGAGIVVDSVSDVVPLADDQVRATPEFGAAVDTRFIAGIGTLDEKMLILLDIETLLDSADLGPEAAFEDAA